jgi:hypothetical protein
VAYIIWNDKVVSVKTREKNTASSFPNPVTSFNFQKFVRRSKGA